MSRTTLGIKVDETTRARLIALAEAKGRTPHWILKTAVAQYLEHAEREERERREDAARWERYMLTGEAIDHGVATAWLQALAEGVDAPCPR